MNSSNRSRRTTPQPPGPLRIGALAEATRTSVETIRFYEREGLLSAPTRTESNYRTYRPEDVTRLDFIRRCRSLDMALPEVRALLEVLDQGGADCEGVNSILDEHIGHVALRIAELKTLEAELRELRARCEAPQAVSSCGILKGLAKREVGGDAAARTPHVHVGGAHVR